MSDQGKGIRRLIRMLLCIVSVFASVQPLKAEEFIQIDPEDFFCINPFYRDAVNEEDLVSEPLFALLQEEQQEYVNTEEAVSLMKEHMLKRDTDAEICWQGTEYYEDAAREIISGVFVHTGVPGEGDNLKLQYAGYHCSMSGYRSGDVYYMTFHYTLTYYTTAEQEEELDLAVEQFMEEENFTAYTSDYDKITAVYEYITETVSYDYDHQYDDDDKLKYTAYAAMISHTAVCQGYANLLYRLALECGIDCRIITGTANGSSHAWNLVKLNDAYYNTDATWDAECIQSGKTYQFYLKSENCFTDHIRGEAFLTEDFLLNYPVSEDDYDPETEVSVTASGIIEGTEISWQLTSGGLLKIYGKGEIAAFTEETPWHEYAQLISVIEISEEITSISEGVFDDLRDVCISGTCGTAGYYYAKEYGYMFTGEHEPAAYDSCDATCTEDGSYGGVYCIRCSEVLEEPVMIPAYGHTYVYGACTRCKEADPSYSFRITEQPASQQVYAGEQAVFCVCTDSQDLSYQWYYRTSAQGKWRTSSSAGNTSDTLSVTAKSANDGYEYKCYIVSSFGEIAESDTAVLHVLSVPGPEVIIQPEDSRTIAGSTAVFHIEAEGTDLLYQWYYRTSEEGTWRKTTAEGNTSDTLQVTALYSRDGYQYRCAVTNAAGGQTFSNTVSLYLLSSIRITLEPDDMTTLAAGETAFLHVEAETSGMEIVQYRWYYKNASGGSWHATTLDGNDTDTLTVTGKVKNNGYQYRCRITAENGECVYTDETTLIIYE